MKVLLVHNYYNSAIPSGENTAVEDEIRLMPQHGIEVLPFVASSDELLTSPAKRAGVAVSPIVSPTTARKLVVSLREFLPDIVHLHNVYPRFGPTVIAVARHMGIPVVQTVHNRRLACVAGTQFRDGHHCEDCLQRRLAWPAVKHRCYRGSVAQSGVMVASHWVHRGRWRELDHYFAVSDSLAEVLLDEGVPAPRISIKPNPIPDPGVSALPATRRVLYAGRLDATKGIKLLLSAHQSLPEAERPHLRICGAGPMAAEVSAMAQSNLGLEFLGARPPQEIYTHIADSSVVAIPSIAGEGLPRILAESFASGRAVLATQYDPVASVIGAERGWCVPDNVASLAEALHEVNTAPTRNLIRLGAAARSYYESNYSPTRIFGDQIAVYGRLCGRS